MDLPTNQARTALEAARFSRRPFVFADALVDLWLADGRIDSADRRLERLRRTPPPTRPVYGFCAVAGRIAVVENVPAWDDLPS